jgi:hypothetical protein
VFGATFLGHQGWLLETERTRLLIDPLLTDRFGHGGTVGEVYPPRIIALDAMPRIDAVLLTHEHEDHFDIPSLGRLDRSTPILLSARSSVAARTIVREMGFELALVSPGDERRIGDLVLHLFGAEHVSGANSDEWDVVQFLVADAGGHGSFFSTVDTACTNATLTRLARIAPKPGLVCHTNNSTNWAFRRAGLVIEREPPLDTVGLAAEVIREQARLRFAWGEPAGTLFCGSGFAFAGERSWLNRNVFFADSRRIAAALAALVPDRFVAAPDPGQRVVMRGGEIAGVDRARFLTTGPESEWPSRAFANDVALMDDYAPACGRTELTDAELDELVVELRELARYLYARVEFRALYSLSATPERRPTLALALLADATRATTVLAWDLQACELVPVDSEDPVVEYVAGIELWGTDLLELFRGSFAPSAVVLGRVRSWSSIPNELPSELFGLWEFFHPLNRPAAYLRLYRALYAREQERAIPRRRAVVE